VRKSIPSDGFGFLGFRALMVLGVAALVALSGCMLVEGGFKYKGTKVEIQTADISGIDIVEMNLGSEDVVVTSDDVREAQFEIKKTYRANDREYGEELLDEAEIIIERDGRRLVVERKNEGRSGLSRITKGYVSIDITVGLPADIELSIHTGSGDVNLAERNAPVEITTGSGDLEVAAAAHDLEARTGSGDIEVGKAGGEVNFHTGSGDVYAREVEGPLDVSTGSGDVSLRSVAGDFEIGTGSGDVEVEISAGDAQASTGSGDISLSHHTGGVDLSTSSGDVILGLDGGRGDVMIKTASGEVDVVLYGGDAYEVDIETGSGSISSRIPLTVSDASRRRLEGHYGEGGFSIRVRTSSGGISLMRGAI
jgi:hypothetical protein